MKKLSTPDSLLQTIVAVIQVILVIIGLLGISFDIFRDHGILKQLLGHMIKSQLGLASIPVLLIGLYIANRAMSSPTDGKESFIGNMPLYLMMSVGLYYVYQYATTGSI